ncbi:MAG: hypothetical protein RSB85_01575 [Rikenellaceae bacterium]
MEYLIRRAIVKDIPFIAKTIIEAEKSMTNECGLANFFGLDENTTQNLLIQILEEEVDGCEFSLSNFMVATYNNEAVAAMGGWLEGVEDGMASAIIKSNLIGYFFPKESLAIARENGAIIEDIQIEREMGTYQLEYSFVEEKHRGNRLINRLMTELLSEAKKKYPEVKKHNYTLLKIIRQ